MGTTDTSNDAWLNEILWIDVTPNGFVEVLFANMESIWSFYCDSDKSNQLTIPSLR